MRPPSWRKHPAGVSPSSSSKRIVAGSETYLELCVILERYISAISMHSTLKSTLLHRRLAPQTMQRADVSAVVEDAMVGMRLFCDPERLPALMLELADFCARCAIAEPPA